MNKKRQTLCAGVALSTCILMQSVPLSAASGSGLLDVAATDKNALYNGIVIPENYVFASDPENGNAVTVPYLLSQAEGGYAPEVINIDRGRQLFIDDFLIESTNLKRTYYSAVKNEANPVFFPETQAELTATTPSVAATSGGIWYDMEEHIYKMWYEAGFNNRLAYATSEDGITWERPAINSDGSNTLVRQQRTDSFSVWIDYNADPDERYKLMIRSPNDLSTLSFSLPANLYTSSNGTSWKYLGTTGTMLDRSTFFYNPFISEWVFSVRGQRTVKWGENWYRPRLRLFSAAPTFFEAGQWDGESALPLWIKPDSKDLIDTTVSNEIPQLYNFDSIAYESVMLGFNQMWYGPTNEVIAQTKNPKITELQVSFSRDGFYYDRPNRNAFISASRTEGAWDYGYLQSTTGGVIVYDNEIRIYYSGFSGEYDVNGKKVEGAYVGGAIGYATLRRDGFASMNGSGTLTTKPLTVTKDVKYLFVNTNTSEGSLRAEIIDSYGNVLDGYSMENCIAVTDNTAKTRISWEGGGDLSALRGKKFSIRFSLENGELYSFWLSPDENGKSGGEIAAGYVGEGISNENEVETNEITQDSETTNSNKNKTLLYTVAGGCAVLAVGAVATTAHIIKKKKNK